MDKDSPLEVIAQAGEDPRFTNPPSSRGETVGACTVSLYWAAPAMPQREGV